ncbi:unnamed protein product [Brugia timori]|uniref:LigA n=1 Tax=Brugia timori TaxID=42155 RepID=A0A0R3QQM4_9BILA|nr:unnamed protein product [Brugia timori]
MPKSTDIGRHSAATAAGPAAGRPSRPANPRPASAGASRGLHSDRCVSQCGLRAENRGGLCRKTRTQAVHQPDLCALDLPVAAAAAQLLHHLEEVQQRPGHAWVREGEQASMGVDRDATAVGDLPIGHEAAALPLRAEAQVLEHHDHRAGEAVVDTGHVDVARADACHCIGLRARLHRAGGGERRHQEDVLVGVALPAAEDVDGLAREVADPVAGRDDEGRSPVGDERTVELVVRRRHPAGAQHVVDGDRLRHLRARRAHRMLAMNDGDLGELLGGGPKLLHVAMCRHREGIRNGNAERHLVLLVTALGHRAQRQVGRQAGQQAVGTQHEHVVRKAAADGGGGDVEHRGRSGAGHLQGVRKRGRDAEVLAERDAEAVKRRGESGARQHAVDRASLDARVRERGLRRIACQGQDAAARHAADGRPASPDDGRPTPEASHARRRAAGRN